MSNKVSRLSFYFSHTTCWERPNSLVVITALSRDGINFLFSIWGKKKSLSVLHLETNSCGDPHECLATRWQYEHTIPHPLPSFCNQFSVPCLSFFSLQVSARHFSFPSLFAIFTCIQMRGQPAGWECHAVLTEGLQWKNGASVVLAEESGYQAPRAMHLLRMLWGLIRLGSSMLLLSWGFIWREVSGDEHFSGEFSHCCRSAFRAFRSSAMLSARQHKNLIFTH